jgi:hypothetical protein
VEFKAPPEGFWEHDPATGRVEPKKPGSFYGTEDLGATKPPNWTKAGWFGKNSKIADWAEKKFADVPMAEELKNAKGPLGWMGRMGAHEANWERGAMRTLVGGFGKAPGMTAVGLGIGLAPLAAMFARGIQHTRMGLGTLDPVGMLGGEALGPEQFRRQIEGQIQMAHYQAAQQRQSNQADMLAQQNLETMARMAPDVYQKLAAGRELPRGARVIGGEPRRDILMEAARQMGNPYSGIGQRAQQEGPTGHGGAGMGLAGLADDFLMMGGQAARSL